MRQKEINNEWFNNTVCKVVFSPMAARLVNSRNLSMSAVRRDVSMRSGCFSCSFYTSAQPSLLWKSVAVLFLLSHEPSMHLWPVSHSVISGLPHTSGFYRTKKVQGNKNSTLTNNNMHFYYSDSKGLCLIMLMFI